MAVTRSANRPVIASLVLRDNSGLTHGQEAKSVRPGQGQRGAIPDIAELPQNSLMGIGQGPEFNTAFRKRGKRQ